MTGVLSAPGDTIGWHGQGGILLDKEIRWYNLSGEEKNGREAKEEILCRPQKCHSSYSSPEPRGWCFLNVHL